MGLTSFYIYSTSWIEREQHHRSRRRKNERASTYKESHNVIIMENEVEPGLARININQRVAAGIVQDEAAAETVTQNQAAAGIVLQDEVAAGVENENDAAEESVLAAGNREVCVPEIAVKRQMANHDANINNQQGGRGRGRGRNRGRRGFVPYRRNRAGIAVQQRAQTTQLAQLLVTLARESQYIPGANRRR